MASRGVSPKTRKQVVSAGIVDAMLTNSINTPNLTESFPKDAVVTEMTKVYNRTGEFPNGFVEGYGMGIWVVDGWRHTAQGLPIKGWLAQGTGMIYFDTTGLVYTFFPKGGFTAAFIRAFRRIIRSIGDFALNEMPGTPVKQLSLPSSQQ